MKSLSLVPVLALVVSASVQRQHVLQTSPIEITPATIHRLLAAHDNDPVEVMRIVDPAYAPVLDEPRLLEVAPAAPAWMTEGDKLRLMNQGLSFTDLTGRENRSMSNDKFQQRPTAAWPDLQHQQRINEVIQHFSVQEMVYNLGNLTAFYNRYYRSAHGRRSARWVHDKVLEIIADAPPNVHVSLETFTHDFPQTTVIARFEPTHGRSRSNHGIKTPIVVLGSHLDSANYDFPLLPAPGADDGGSGTVTLLEAFRALVRAGFRPAFPVEFHWYAAEEGGLLGSQDVAAEYVYQRKDVAAMIQFDMTAYVHEDATPTLTFITNDVDKPLTGWVMQLAGAYTSMPVAGATLFPGGVSDHLSWHRAGFPVVCATESDPSRTPNPYIHTVDDRTDVEEGEFSFEYALEFAKVAVGFAVELGRWED